MNFFSHLCDFVLIKSISIVPSEDAHGSEYVASSDKRREFICG